MLRREKIVDITYWKRRGMSKRQIAAKLGVHRNTVTRYLEKQSVPTPCREDSAKSGYQIVNST